MDLLQMKHWVRNNGDKFILVEDGEPQMVVMSFHEYEKLTKGVHDMQEKTYAVDFHANGHHERERMEGHEEETTMVKETEFIMPDERTTRNIPLAREHIRLEDLPI